MSTKFLNLDTDSTFAQNSNTSAASQKATKSYVDTSLQAKQSKTLSEPVVVEGQPKTTVEGALSALSDAISGGSSNIGYVAGDNIEFRDVIDLDSHTLMLLHCNESLDDSSQYAATLKQETTGDVTWTASPTYQNGKFGKALQVINSTVSTPTWKNTAFSAITTDMTIDFWFYYDTSVNQYSTNFRFYSNSHYLGIEFYVYQNSLIAYCSKDGMGVGNLASTFAPYLTDKAWNHFAVCLKSGSNDSKIYINGNLAFTYNFGFDFSTGLDYILSWTNSYLQIDEFRLSDVIRYTENFDVPTKPYGQVINQSINATQLVKTTGDTMTGKLDINCTGTHMRMITSEVNASSTPATTAFGNYIDLVDNNTVALARIACGSTSDGYNEGFIQAFDGTNTHSTSIGIKIAKDGSYGCAFAPSPDANAAGLEITTAAWVINYVQTYVQTYVQNYVNTAVSNVLKQINFANAVSFTASYSGGVSKIYTDYTTPSDGYFFITTVGNGYIISNKTYTIGNVLFPVKAYTTIRTVITSVSDPANTYGWFFPQV